MSVKSTGQSERINVQLETKKEIVLTLLEYPLVVKELNVTNQLLGKCNEIRTIQEAELSIKDKQILLLNKDKKNLYEQRNLLLKQLKRQKLKPYLVAGIGVAAILLIK